MSQKSSRRLQLRKKADDETSTSSKGSRNGDEAPIIVEEDLSVAAREAKEIKQVKEVAPEAPAAVGAENGAVDKDKSAETIEVTRRTRSRSRTPQKSKQQESPGVNNGLEKIPENGAEPEPDPEMADLPKSNGTDSVEIIEMDPLIVTDETEPELFFEENSDRESGKGSPVIVSRCKTRRGANRNIPTPKTPKLDEIPLEKSEEDITFESYSETASTKAQAGNDSTRLNSSILESSSFLNSWKDKSFGDACRFLPTRRTIRPLGEDYRRIALKKNSKELNASSSESVSVGTKRRNSSGSESDTSKRFRGDSPGFFARFTSPLNTIRASFRHEPASSTPKLTLYKDGKCNFEGENANKYCDLKEADVHRSWCSIM